MSGTLIGVFITATAVVVGTDTALVGPDEPPGRVVTKHCVTSPRSVATIQGQYELPANKHSFAISLINFFHD